MQGKPDAAQLAERFKISNDDDGAGERVLPEHVYNLDELKKLIEATEQGNLERALVMVPTLCGQSARFRQLLFTKTSSQF